MRQQGPSNIPLIRHWQSKPGPTDYRPVLAVIAIVIFRLALIAFIFTLRTGT